ncbi:PRE_C2HC domain-containing protein [Trichonephila clavipes]|nr:PRE_C2HC domain-containing protein [Trichonephila clavipes]
MASISDDSMTLESRTPSRSSTPTPSSLCAKRMELTNDIQQLSLLIRGTNDTINSLIRFGSFNPEDENVAMLQNLLHNYTSRHQQAVIKKNPQKRKENEEGFITPPLSKVNKRTNNASQLNFEIELSNKFQDLNQETVRTSTGNENNESDKQHPSTSAIPQNLPPPVMLKVNQNYTLQMKTITDKLPTVRGKLSGEYLKLYTNSPEQKTELIKLLEILDYEFYAIKSKSERPIKVVIKGLPRATDTNNIHHELVMLGYTVDKVTQLFGRITKQKLPVFLITLPRNIHNSKIFDLNRLCYLTVNVEGYEGKGVTHNATHVINSITLQTSAI